MEAAAVWRHPFIAVYLLRTLRGISGENLDVRLKASYPQEHCRGVGMIGNGQITKEAANEDLRRIVKEFVKGFVARCIRFYC